MIPGAEPEAANAVAEEILQMIYGDDLNGCAVRVDAIASIILRAMHSSAALDREMLGLYEKATEALHLLSRPPAPATLPAPHELQMLLSERLDAIHQLTQKLIDTTAALKGQTSSP